MQIGVFLRRARSTRRLALAFGAGWYVVGILGLGPYLMVSAPPYEILPAATVAAYLSLGVIPVAIGLRLREEG